MIISAIFCIAGISFFVAAGKPGLGFGLSVAGGVTNIVQDYVPVSYTHLPMIAVVLPGSAVKLISESTSSSAPGYRKDT